MQVLRAAAEPLGVVSIWMVGVVVQGREVPRDLPLAIPAMLGTAISILLGSKTRAAHDRWREARKVWGRIVHVSR
ncbi:MAG: bestrophin family ion channel [Planctomycetota bacterium]